MGPRVWFSHLLSFLCLIENYRASPGHPQSCCGLAVRTVLLMSEEKTRGVRAFLNREMGIAVQAASDKETQQHLQEACQRQALPCAFGNVYARFLQLRISVMLLGLNSVHHLFRSKCPQPAVRSQMLRSLLEG